MDSYSDLPSRDGVFGPELLVNVEDGKGCLQSTNGVIAGVPPRPPATNGFVVWVGFPVVVVSEGVSIINERDVSEAVRQLVNIEQAPVIFSRGSSKMGTGGSAWCNDLFGHAEHDLALAFAYAEVQAGWREEDSIVVDLNDCVHAFALKFVAMPDGTYLPTLI